MANERARGALAATGGDDNSALLMGLIQGLTLNLGDDVAGLWGGRDAFVNARNSDPHAYDTAAMGGLFASPVATMFGRLPLAARGRAFEEARDLLTAEGVAQRELPRARGQQGVLAHIPSRNDISHMRGQGRTADANRLAQDRADAIDANENELAVRRGRLDDWATGLAGAHGAAIGFGGVDPEGSPIEERLLGAGLGAGLSTGLMRLAPEVKDLSGYALRPLTGRGAPGRFSAQDVIDLPGAPNTPADAQGYFNRLRMLEEEAHRGRAGDTFFGRAAMPTGSRVDPSVAPISDTNTMVRGSIQAALNSPTGQQRMREMGNTATVQDAQDRISGLSSKMGAAPMGNLVPPQQRVIPQAMREDPAMRPDGLRTVLGDKAYANVDRELLSPMQMRSINPAQYPGLNPQQRQEMARLIVEDAMQVTRQLASAQGRDQVEQARRVIAYLDDPHVKRLFQNLMITDGPRSPEVAALVQLRTRLSAIAEGGQPTMATLTGGFQRGDNRGVNPVVTEAAMDLSSQPMSKRMAEALLDADNLTTRQDAYWLNPQNAGDESLLQLRREEQRPPWPFAAPPGWGTELAATTAAIGGEYGLHNLLEQNRR